MKQFKSIVQEKEYSIKISIENNFINIFIEEVDSIPPIKYEKSFSDENLKNLSKYFLMFDNIEESFYDIVKLMNNKFYEFFEGKDMITLFFKTGISKKDFKMEIPVKKIKIEDRVEELTQIIKKQQNEINMLKKINSVKEYNKLLDKFTKIEKLINFKNENNYKDFNESLLLDYRQKNILLDLLRLHTFEQTKLNYVNKKSQINIEENIKNFFSKDDLEDEKIKRLIPKNNISILTKLLYTASVNGDSKDTFHKYCDFSGPTITIIKSEQGKIFGGYKVSDFNKNYFYKNQKCFIFFLDIGVKIDVKEEFDSFDSFDEHYKNNGPTFGRDLIISDSCLSNNNSFIKYSEYNDNKEKFKVIDYEVFSVYFSSFN